MSQPDIEIRNKKIIGLYWKGVSRKIIASRYKLTYDNVCKILLERRRRVRTVQIKITLSDQENGHVKIDCNPPLNKLHQIYKEGSKMTPAMTYAIKGIKRMLDDSEYIAKEREKERREAEIMSKGILPWHSDLTKGPLSGPQDIN